MSCLVLMTGCAPRQAGLRVDEAACRADGGKVMAVTMVSRICALPTSDADRPCSDDGECQGACLPASTAGEPPACAEDDGIVLCGDLRRQVRAGAPAEGGCAAVRLRPATTNCLTHVVDGRRVVEACVD